MHGEALANPRRSGTARPLCHAPRSWQQVPDRAQKPLGNFRFRSGGFDKLHPRRLLGGDHLEGEIDLAMEILVPSTDPVARMAVASGRALFAAGERQNESPIWKKSVRTTDAAGSPYQYAIVS